MSNAINRPPQPQSHGLDFNYAVWSAGTQVTLCNVPWNSDYRDIVKFPDGQKGLDAFLLNQNGPTTDTGKKLTYARFGDPVKLSIPFNAAFQYNYMRVWNPAQPVNGGDTARAYYYFITAVEYKAPNTTLFQLQLDVFQTFGYDIKFGNCYIERGHIGIANENQFDDYGRTYLTVPEGLDVGGEYQVVKRATEEIASARNLDSQGNPNYEVMVVSTVSLTDDPGDVNNPNLVTANGSDYETLPNGCDIYVFKQSDFMAYVSVMKTKPWFTQGIVGIYAIPAHTRYEGSWQAVQLPTINGGHVNAVRPHYGPLATLDTPTMANWRDNVTTIPDRYSHLKKFLTYPYMVCEVTAYTGTPVMLKPESWADDHASVREVAHFAPPGARIALVPHRYNGHADVPVEQDQYGVLNDGAEWLDVASLIANFPSFSIVNNSAIAYLASNAHSIAFNFQNADWSQQKALYANNASYDVQSAGIDASNQSSLITQQTATLNKNNANDAAFGHLMTGMAGSAASGAMAGGSGAGAAAGAAVGMTTTAVNGAIDAAQRNTALSIANQNTARQNAVSTGLAGFSRDTNKRLADWAAKGDYAMEVNGLNAKLQDVRLTQPSVSGQVGGDAFNLATSRIGYDVKIRSISQGVMSMIGEYWLRYGYAVQRFGRIPDSLQVMSKFTYWKLKETYVIGSACPETFKQSIRGIFEKGVTVWNSPNDIGNIDMADNTPLAGVTL